MYTIQSVEEGERVAGSEKEADPSGGYADLPTSTRTTAQERVRASRSRLKRGSDQTTWCFVCVRRRNPENRTSN